MTQPPAPGLHATYRRLETPGPLGVNDHGDPSNERRRGATPGALGDDDHGMPLSEKLWLITDPNDDEIRQRIAAIVAQANASLDARDLAQKLRLCLDAIRNDGDKAGTKDPKAHYLEAYFRGRLLTLEAGFGHASGDNDWLALASDRLGVPGDEQRRVGSFFRSPGVATETSPGIDPYLSYSRIAQSSPNRQPRSGDHAAYWFGIGRGDGLRDHDAQDKDLPTYALR